MAVIRLRVSLAWLGPGELVEDATLTLEGGRVASIEGPPSNPGVPRRGGSLPSRGAGPDDEIELDGFLMPGVADRHVHVAFADPASLLRGGLTACRDLGWRPEDVVPLADASESPSFNGPLIRTVGPILTCPGGYPTRAGWAPRGTGLEVAGPEAAARAVGDVVDRTGFGVVKVALNADAGPTLPDADLVAICDAAHARGAVVTVHAQGRGQVERALGAGADELAHCPWSERLPDDLVTAVARRMRIVSTLDIHSRGRDTPQLRIALDNLARFVEAGGAVVYGTDLGNGPIPAGIHAGEAWLLRRAGLSPERVLETLAFRPLAPGVPADLVVLAGNPLEDLSALERIALVTRGGRVAPGSVASVG